MDVTKVDTISNTTFSTIEDSTTDFFGENKNDDDFYSKLLNSSVGARNGLNVFTRAFTSGRNINHSSYYDKDEKINQLIKGNKNIKKFGNTFVKKLNSGIEVVYELDGKNRVVGRDYIIPAGGDNKFLVLNFPLKQIENKNNGEIKTEIYDFLNDSREEIEGLDVLINVASRANVVRYDVKKNKFDTIDIKAMNLITDNYGDDSIKSYKQVSLNINHPLIYNQLMYKSGVIKEGQQLLAQLLKSNMQGETVTHTRQLFRFIMTLNTDGDSIYDNAVVKHLYAIGASVLLPITVPFASFIVAGTSVLDLATGKKNINTMGIKKDSFVDQVKNKMLKEIVSNVENGKVISERDAEFLHKYSSDKIIAIKGTNNTFFKLLTTKQLKEKIEKSFSNIKDINQIKEEKVEKSKTVDSIEQVSVVNRQSTNKILSLKESQVELSKSVDKVIKELVNDQQKNRDLIIDK